MGGSCICDGDVVPTDHAANHPMLKRLSSRDYAMMAVFSLTVFVSASLLFVVQPMVGKLILPELGGSSSVWTTCMLFFQSMLVVGYVYAHYLARHVEPARQIWVHLAVIAAAGLVGLPLGVPADLLDPEGAPALSLLLALFVGAGLPAFVVSTSAPLFQRWYAYTDHPDADDPYYLYAASNVGSMLALVGYPFVIEPLVGVDTQRIAWSVGFALLGLLAAGCAWFLSRRARRSPTGAGTDRAADSDAPKLTWRRRAVWIGWAFLPSSLMLGLTEYMTT
ncbi:MAG: spermidine synthase, partial [Persicimonas sp.]